jgi:hypothetical protein
MPPASQMVISADLTKRRTAVAGHHFTMPLSVLRIVLLHLLLLTHRGFAVQVVKGMFHRTITSR